FDIFGALMMLLVGFGWAKPVPINPRNFRNPKWGFAIVAIAGPAMNLIIAFISVFLMQLVTFIAGLITSESVLVYNIFSYTCILFYYMAYMNVGFAVFNMIPIPPFDGSRLVSAILPPNLSAKYNRIEAYTRYIFIAVIALTWLPAPFSKITQWLFFPIDWLREAIVNLFTAFWELIF
ncbi:MAG: site-2 protease family protein, partial [Clostridia bacterium]